MVEWSRAFGGVPIYLHEEDREWVQRPDPVIRFWKGETYSLVCRSICMKKTANGHKDPIP